MRNNMKQFHLLFTSLIMTSIAGISSGVCKDGWIRHELKCIRYFPKRIEWIEAELECVAESGTLLSVNSKEENDIAKRLLPLRRVKNKINDDVYTSAWLSFSTDHMDLNPLSPRMEDLNFTDWKKGISIQETAGYCVKIARTEKWIQESCEEKNGFLCEGKLLVFEEDWQRETMTIDERLKRHRKWMRPIQIEGDEKVPLEVRSEMKLASMKGNSNLEKVNKITLLLDITLSWVDRSLQWEPEFNDGVTSIQVELNKIWAPQILILTPDSPQNTGAAPIVMHLNGINPKAVAAIESSGRVKWTSFNVPVPFVMKIPKHGEIHGGFKLTSQIGDKTEINLIQVQNNIDTSKFALETSWTVNETSVSRLENGYKPEPSAENSHVALDAQLIFKK